MAVTVEQKTKMYDTPENTSINESHGIPSQNPDTPSEWGWQSFLTLINHLGVNFSQIKGVAQSATNPGASKVGDVWFWGDYGSYPYFGQPVTEFNQIGFFLKGASSWSKYTIKTLYSYSIKDGETGETIEKQLDDVTRYNSSTGNFELRGESIRDATITLNAFSQAVLDYIGSGGTITNNPDERHLDKFTDGVEKLRVKDGFEGKTYLYNPGQYATAEDLKTAVEALVAGGDVHLVIDENVDGGGLTWTLPTGTIFDVARSGYVSNVTFAGSYDVLEKPHPCFDPLTVNFTGTFRASKGIRPQMFNSVYKGESSAALQKCLDFESESEDAFIIWPYYYFTTNKTLNSTKPKRWVNEAKIYATEDFANTSSPDNNCNPVLIFGTSEKSYVNDIKKKYTDNVHFTLTNVDNSLMENDPFIRMNASHDLSTLSKGDKIMMWSMEGYSYLSSRTGGYIQSLRKGEEIEVFEIDNVTKIITLTKGLSFSYNTKSDNVFFSVIEKYSPKIDALDIKAVHEWDYTGSDSPFIDGVYFTFLDNFEIDNLKVKNAAQYATLFINCTNGVIKNREITGTYQMSPTAYAQEWLGCNNDVRILSDKISMCRHAFDAVNNGFSVSSESVNFGITDRIFISNYTYTMHDSEASFTAIDPHGAVRRIFFSHGIIQGINSKLPSEYNPSTPYSVGSIVKTNQDSTAYTVNGQKLMRYLIKIGSNETVGGEYALTDKTQWKVIYSSLAYLNYQDWVSGETISSTNTKRRHKGYYWLSTTTGVLSEPSHDNNQWVVDQSTRINGAIKVRSNYKEGMSFSDTMFINIHQILQFSEGTYNNVSFNNCKAFDCNTFLYPRDYSDVGDINMNTFHFERVDKLLDLSTTSVRSFTKKLHFKNCTSYQTGLAGTDNVMHPNLEEIRFGMSFKDYGKNVSNSLGSTTNKITLESSQIAATTFVSGVTNATSLKSIYSFSGSYWMNLKNGLLPDPADEDVNAKMQDWVWIRRDDLKSYAFKSIYHDRCEMDNVANPLIRIQDNTGGVDFEITLDGGHIKRDGNADFDSHLIENSNPSKINVINGCHIDNGAFRIFGFSVVANELNFFDSTLKSSYANPFERLSAIPLIRTKGTQTNFDITPVSGKYEVVEIGEDLRKNGVKSFVSFGSPETVISADKDSICYDSDNDLHYKKLSGTGNTGWGIEQWDGSDESALTTYTLDCRLNNKFKKTIGAATTFTFNVDGYAEGQFIKFNIWADANAGVGVAPSYDLSTGTLTVKSKASNYDNTLFTNIEVGLYITASGADAIIYETSA